MPLGARTGQVAVTGPGASGSSTSDFTVVVTHARLSFKLGGLTNGGLHSGQKVSVTGVISPFALAGSKVTVTIQKKWGARWATAKSLPLPTSGAGVFRGAYKPSKSGSYRARASIAGTDANTAAATAWKAFTVNWRALTPNTSQLRLKAVGKVSDDQQGE